MAGEEISRATRDLIDAHIASMDHVQALLYVREQTDPPLASEVAAGIGLDDKVVGAALRELVAGGLLVEEAGSGRYRYAPRPDAEERAVEELATLYQTRPVTLVRALYDRPSIALRSFADAFRLRKPGA